MVSLLTGGRKECIYKRKRCVQKWEPGRVKKINLKKKLHAFFLEKELRSCIQEFNKDEKHGKELRKRYCLGFYLLVQLLKYERNHERLQRLEFWY